MTSGLLGQDGQRAVEKAAAIAEAIVFADRRRPAARSRCRAALPPPAGIGMFHTPFSSRSPGRYARKISGRAFSTTTGSAALPPRAITETIPGPQIGLAAKRPVEADGAPVDIADRRVEPLCDRCRTSPRGLGRNRQPRRDQPLAFGLAPARTSAHADRRRMFAWRFSNSAERRELRRIALPGSIVVAGSWISPKESLLPDCDRGACRGQADDESSPQPVTQNAPFVSRHLSCTSRAPNIHRLVIRSCWTWPCPATKLKVRCLRTSRFTKSKS